jgi:4'-phosphopantetheinyl transferase
VVTVALLDVTRVGAEELARLRATLSPSELEKAERMSDARLHICARGLVRRCLSRERPETPAEAWTFERTEAGKPFVTGPAPGPSFSLSHTDGLVAVAVGECGVDVEALSRGNEILDTVLRAFAPAELEEVRLLPADDQVRRAVELWTAKEAYLKALGTGISRHLDRVVLTHLGNGAWRVEESRDWRVETRVVLERWVLATAVPANEAIAYRPAAKPAVPET